MTRCRSAGVILLGASALALDVAVLRGVGLFWGDQLSFLAILAAWSLAGHLFLSRWDRLLPDPFTAYAVSAALGMTLYAGLCFVLFHTSVWRLTGLRGPRAAAWAAFALLLVPALVEARRVWRATERRPSLTSTYSVPVIFVLASVVALLSAFGVANNETGLDPSEDRRVSVRKLVEAGPSAFTTNVVPEWGSRQDRESHIMNGPWRVAELGFPAAFGQGFQHYGVESLLAGLSLLRGPFSIERSVAFSKPLSLLWLFLVPYWALLIARLTARLSEGLALWAATGVLFYSALNAFALWAPVSSYRVAPISGTLYHNTTQQASLAVGLAGLYLALLGLRERRSVFPLGCLLLSGSLIFKPSLFTIAAPSLSVAVALHGRTAWRPNMLAGVGLMATAVVVWFGYPRLLQIDMLASPIEPAFFPWHSFHAPERIPWSVWSAPSLAVSVLGLSYAAFLLAPIGLGAPWHGVGRRLRAALSQPDVVALVVLFALSVTSGLLLVEGNWRHSQGNFMWGYAAGHLTFLPFVVRGISRIANTFVRRLAWTVYVAHLVSGAWNLFLLAYAGVL